MSDFAKNVSLMTVADGEIGLFWLGQAGFLFKLDDGRLIVVDPYFSDCCNRYFGFKRLMPYIVGVNELEYDIFISSHAHYDHFDVDSIGTIMACQKTELVCTYDCRAECDRFGIREHVTYIKTGDVLSRDGVTIKAVPCDHGKDTPDAVGIILEYKDKKIYIMGDTCYKEDYFSNSELKDCDVLILPINGAFGNLNENEAADMAESLTPHITIPCHFWNFAEHGGNPARFAENMKKKNLKYKIFRIGEGMVL